MKNIVKLFTFIMLTFIVVLFFACKSTEKVEEVTPATENVENVIVSTTATDWNENIFAGNDQHGYFFTTPELGQFTMIEGEFKKSGGYEKSGYGFVFGYTADDNGWLSDYLRFEINTSGEYAVFACKGSTYIDLIENHGENTAYMNVSSAINGGYDSVNKLKIQKVSEKGYDLFINNTKIASITVPTGYGNSDGVMAFFSVGKENQEDFPNQPVRVTYRIINSDSTAVSSSNPQIEK